MLHYIPEPAGKEVAFHPIWAKVPTGQSRDEVRKRARLTRFLNWHDQTGQPWWRPNLEGYRDYLRFKEGLMASTTRTYVSHIRSAYKEILTNNDIRDWLYQETVRIYPDAPPERRRAVVQELLDRIRNGIDKDRTRVPDYTIQDHADDDHLRLTSNQVDELLTLPNLSNSYGFRDRAAIAIMATTGIRSVELLRLVVVDLHQEYNGEPALLVRRGKGYKRRMIPYGENIWMLDLVAEWLKVGGIKKGPILRGYQPDRKTLRPGAMSHSAPSTILSRYPLRVNVDGQIQQIVVKPHDLRRTYARLMYDAGMELVAIQQNLGHTDPEMTERYIGRLDPVRRRGINVFTYPQRMLGV